MNSSNIGRDPVQSASGFFGEPLQNSTTPCSSVEVEKSIEKLLTDLDLSYSETFTLRLLKWLSGVFASANIFFSYAAERRDLVNNYYANNISIMTYNMLGVAQFPHDINHLINWQQPAKPLDEKQKKSLAQQLIHNENRIKELASSITAGKADIVALQEVTKGMWDMLKPHLRDYSFIIRTPNSDKSAHGVGLIVKKEIASCVVTAQVAELSFKTMREYVLTDLKRNVALLTLDFVKRKWTVLSAHVPQIQSPENKTLNNQKETLHNIEQIQQHFINASGKVAGCTNHIFVAAADFNQRMQTDEAQGVLKDHGFKNFISEKVRHDLNQPEPSSECGIDHILFMAGQGVNLDGQTKRIESQNPHPPSDHNPHVTDVWIKT